jgi:hypothetical protein
MDIVDTQTPSENTESTTQQAETGRNTSGTPDDKQGETAIPPHPTDVDEESAHSGCVDGNKTRTLTEVQENEPPNEISRFPHTNSPHRL